MNTGKLIFFCGKMGAGKSTRSKVITQELGAVRLSEDEWLAAHYPDEIKSLSEYMTYSSRIKPFVKAHVQSLLKLGIDVVMDFPANTTNQRAWFTSLCSEVGCQHEMVYLNVSDEQCLQQIAKRRLEEPARAKFDTEDVFHQVTKYFEEPNESENLAIV